MRTLLTLIILLPGVLLFGQKDAAAEKYLDKVARDLDPGHALKIAFDYAREDLQSEAALEGSGTLVLMGEKYKLDMDEAVIWFDGEKQYSLNTDVGEVYVSIPDPENKEFMFSDPIRLLRNYKDTFKYRVVGATEKDGKSLTEIQLYPEELGGPYALIKIYFATGSSELHSIAIRHKEGIVYTMNISELDRMEDPGETFFRFSSKEYPDVDVIDLL
jgi:outer membrane lipoprotein-sorting protein